MYLILQWLSQRPTFAHEKWGSIHYSKNCTFACLYCLLVCDFIRATIDLQIVVSVHTVKQRFKLQCLSAKEKKQCEPVHLLPSFSLDTVVYVIAVLK